MYPVGHRGAGRVREVEQGRRIDGACRCRQVPVTNGRALKGCHCQVTMQILALRKVADQGPLPVWGKGKRVY